MQPHSSGRDSRWRHRRLEDSRTAHRTNCSHLLHLHPGLPDGRCWPCNKIGHPSTAVAAESWGMDSTTFPIRQFRSGFMGSVCVLRHRVLPFVHLDARHVQLAVRSVLETARMLRLLPAPAAHYCRRWRRKTPSRLPLRSCGMTRLDFWSRHGVPIIEN